MGGLFANLRTESDNWLRLDMLRFAASVGVVWHHSQEYYLRVPANREWALLVDLFFVISGFIISAIYSEKVGSPREVGRFLQKRAARLMPLVLLALACSVLLWRLIIYLDPGDAYSPDLSPACVAHSAAMLHAFWQCGDAPAVGGVSWSIGIEMMLYTLFPLIVVMARGKWLLETAFAAALVGLLLNAPDGLISDAPKVWRGLPSFLFGVLLFKYRARLRLASALPALLAALVASVAIRGGEFLSLALVYAVGISAVSGDMTGEAPRWVRRLAPCGSLTFSLYMWHPLFITAFMYLVAHKLLHLPAPAMIGAGLICYATLAVWSYWSWVYFEEPMRKRIGAFRLHSLRPSR